jgi:outer membrane protein assembly factor BamD
MGLSKLDCCSDVRLASVPGHVLRRLRLALALLVASCVLSACGIFGGKEIDKTEGWSASKLYAEAQGEMEDKNWSAALKLLESLQSRYPFGRFAQQALMETAYVRYKDNEPALARATADRFIKQYPNHPNVDYLYYLRGLASFNDNLGLLSSLSRQDLTERDPKALRESFDAFKEVIVRFPAGPYAADSELRMRYLVNAMAQHQIHVATYYMRRGAFLAAANRAQNVMRDYQQAPAVEEALYIMVMAYDALHMNDLRDDAKSVLSKNFPNTELYARGLRKRDVAWWQLW